ncbi:diguanylate cyclase domain-containing protein [Chitinilyticum piscinae]|uniref:Diguanylate cyclase n=1 Tax=Chitinilyticum piscinae TaxID=2866724 RepID=A0A8J7FIH2_9NEIS|nr:diguanylate cyclase [Chitinilyticum piscinae]MBE9610053.1 diguanylate cyclase [Chitinilyticum piscinae]
MSATETRPVLPGRAAFIVSHYRLIVSGIYLLAALVMIPPAWVSMREIDRDIRSLAHERGTALFQMVELSREWNARHGGVYVPVTPDMQPNTYLHHPQRDITDQSGRQLTLVNPAYMTRQIADLAAAREGVRFHLTSLRPLRPGNEPDAWEASALGRFERVEASEQFDFLPDGAAGLPGPVYRYMAPLHVKQACMRCHAAQGYRVGDVRGGISVTIPAKRLEVLVSERNRQIWLLFGLVGFALAGLGHLLIWRARAALQHVARIHADQEQLIAERTRELSQAADEQRVAAAVFDSATAGLIVTDPQAHILRVNPAFCRMSGYSAAELIGQTPALLRSGRHDAAFYAQLREQLQREGSWQGELWNRRKDGEPFAVWLAISTIASGSTGECFVGSYTDITKRKEAEAIILHRANHDALTGLPNRSLFADRLGTALALSRRHGSQLGLLFIDLDGFKRINDTLGHAAGDELLVQAAQRMQQCVREVDTLARLGGDEFAVILGSLREEHECAEVAERLNHALARQFDLMDGSVRIACSIGIALAPLHATTELELRRLADMALYKAKGRGGNTWQMTMAGGKKPPRTVADR